MKYIFFVSLLTLSFQSLAQKDDYDKIWNNQPPAFNNFYSDGQGEKLSYEKKPLLNFETYVFADTLLVRASPQLKGAVQDTIFVGDDVKIVDGAEIFKIGNRAYPWLKISYTNAHNIQKVGYAWGGLISFKALRRGNTKFVYGIPKMTKTIDGYSQAIVQVKAVENKKAIAKIDMTIDAASGGFSNAVFWNSNGLSNITNVMLVTFSGEACGIPTYYFYLLWDGKKFYPAPKSESISDAGVFL